MATNTPPLHTDIQQVGEKPTPELSERLLGQNKAVERTIKANPALHKIHHDVDIASPTPELYRGIDTEEDKPIAERLATGKLSHEDLYRANKSTPHQPASVFLKYAVHRLNNINKYDDPMEAIKSDQDFLELHKKGKAAKKNGHITANNLHTWLAKNPHIPQHLLDQKAELHRDIQRGGTGLNVKDIGGEPHIALARGLDSDMMNREHTLSSWSDLADVGFGTTKHRAWVPLKDLWFSYQHRPDVDSHGYGHENEYLVSHTAPKYEAEPNDVKRVLGHGPEFWKDATDEELANHLAESKKYSLIKHPNAGPKTLDAYHKTFKGSSPPITSKFVTREEALANPNPLSIENPNLTTEDLSQKALDFIPKGRMGSEELRSILSHPKATAETARTIASQYIPGDNNYLLDELADSPLSPPDVLDKAVERSVGNPHNGDFAIIALRNPNLTTEQADRIAEGQFSRATGPDSPVFGSGRFSPEMVNKISEEAGKDIGEGPKRGDYNSDEEYSRAIEDYDVQSQRKSHFIEALQHLANNENLDEDATRNVIEASQQLDLLGALDSVVMRHHRAPLSESNQLALIQALDSSPNSGLLLASLALSKGLSPNAIKALALHPDANIRESLYRNKTVDPEMLAQAWPGGDLESAATSDPIALHLSGAVRDRRAYQARKQKEHIIKPWPKGLAKNEEDMWPLKLQEWMAERAGQEVRQGYYYQAKTLNEARQIVCEKFIHPEPTTEIIDGKVVFAYPAKDANYHLWEENPTFGDALVYFETDDPPIYFDTRVYWNHDVVLTEAKIAGIRADNQKLAKTFNGEKNMSPDETGSQFPFMGGPKKEQSEGSELPPIFQEGMDLQPGEHATALAQLGHNDRLEEVLAAACFLARKKYDPDKLQQGLAVYGDECRAALHAVDLSDGEKNLRALEAVIKLQSGKAKPTFLSKAEPETTGMYSVEPGNEDAIDTADAIRRAMKAGTIKGLTLNGKHSKGALAARDPKSGRIWLIKPGSGKPSPAAGIRDGTASQSRREAAFWHVADKVGLGGAIPKSELLIVNGSKEWAAIKLLDSSFKSLDEKSGKKMRKGREVLGPYLASGLLHRLSILLWILGEADAHAQNMLVSPGGSISLIDHGSSMAGQNYSPGTDSKSFIPFILRVWGPDKDFKKMTPEQRVKVMPRLGHYEDDILKRWVLEDFKPDMVEHVLRKYGMDDIIVKACLARLEELRHVSKDPSTNLSEHSNRLWAGDISKPKAAP